MNLFVRILLLIIIVPPAVFFFSSIFSMFLVLAGLHLSTFALPMVYFFGVIATIPVVIFVLKSRIDDSSMGLRTAVRMGAIVVGSVASLGGRLG